MLEALFWSVCVPNSVVKGTLREEDSDFRIEKSGIPSCNVLGNTVSHSRHNTMYYRIQCDRPKRRIQQGFNIFRSWTKGTLHIFFLCFAYRATKAIAVPFSFERIDEIALDWI